MFPAEMRTKAVVVYKTWIGPSCTAHTWLHWGEMLGDGWLSVSESKVRGCCEQKKTEHTWEKNCKHAAVRKQKPLNKEESEKVTREPDSDGLTRKHVIVDCFVKQEFKGTWFRCRSVTYSFWRSKWRCKCFPGFLLPLRILFSLRRRKSSLPFLQAFHSYKLK